MSSLATQTDVRQTELRNDAADEAMGTLAHDLRQPLSSIETIAYHLSMILPPGDAKVQAQLARIRELVEQSNSILSSALGLAPVTGSAPRAVAPRA